MPELVGMLATSRLLWVVDVDDGGAGGAVDVADIGEIAVDHDLPAAGAIEIADLANAFALTHSKTPLESSCAGSTRAFIS